MTTAATQSSGRLSATPELTALAALFRLTLRQHLRARRLIVVSMLFLLPSVLAVVLTSLPHRPSFEEIEFALIYNLIPHALAPLTALLYAAGVVQDEVEEQTLTYLLVRPLPRWALYVTKLAATVLVTSVIVGAFTTLALFAIHWDEPGRWATILTSKAWKVALLLALAQLGYCSLFGMLGLMYRRRALIFGVGYIISFEGLLATFDSLVRQLTVMYYFRVLVVRWLSPPQSNEWSINLATAPDAVSCVSVLVVASTLFTALSAWWFGSIEFRMKTPEGS